MNILIINSGSSSIKYQLIEMPSTKVICVGSIERIGSSDAISTYRTDTNKVEKIYEIASHKKGLEKITSLLLDVNIGVLNSTDDIDAIGHRVVHGGSNFTKTTLINDEVKNKIKFLSSLAPLHNPANLEGILMAEEIFDSAKQIAVFDTAFHGTVPVKAKKYAIPNELYNEKGIQAYGFHGTSHKYVSEKANAYLQKKSTNLISVHLGNGCSITAIKDGKSIDHSMGFTPANGLIMGTRSGDIDHSVIFYLVNTLGYNLNEVNELLNKKSGMLGLTGFNDLRDIEREATKGNTNCILALEMNAYRIKKFIGSYTAAMNGLDAIIFTAGIGENSSFMRQLVCKDMEYFNIHLDDSKNDLRASNLREINTKDSAVKILVIPTNEELEIANQVYELLA
ncbi:acetate/propionate family kinase [Maribacter hydrothermalis]|uniref:Acetate kinase n=1 Tax=Maribacter hydrothermalis TaxID=1836467 RepID=A0A1B7Z011_9FLAO|nr:acetate kinase [Maribacter hydrothermalis]APQ16255.1 acetate kinase [Maribacter hydrothermalis]OBR36057.1 acetate kinase [Maribacter hydrothermalis]